MSRRTLILIASLTGITVVLLSIALLAQQPKPTDTKPYITQTAPPTPTPKIETLLMLSPNLLTISSQSGSLQVDIDSGNNDLTAVQLELIYNPKLITIVDVKPGSFFGNSAEILPKQIDQKAGRITYIAGVQPTQSAVKGKGTVAVITFTSALTAGQSTIIDFLANKSQATDANDLKNSVLKTTSGATILYSPKITP